MSLSCREDSDPGGFTARNIVESEFPAEGNNIDKLEFFLNYVILAPSSHNTQPWNFKIISDSTIEIYADRTRALSVVDPDDRELTISCGAALYNLQLAISYFGYTFKTSWIPDENNDDLLSSINIMSIEENPNKTDNECVKKLLTSITKRRTNRFKFENKEIPQPIISELELITSKQKNIWLHTLEVIEEKEQFSNLITESVGIQMSDKRFRRELASWVHSNRSFLGDGMPGYALGFSDIMSLIAPSVIRTFDMGKGHAAKDKDLALGSPILMVIWANSDNKVDWLNAGLILSNILLYLKSESI
ncbi:Acg family FMN-binding oxidoreductase [Candidatus Nitrosocosmicus arcticus]|uniref:Nitroreductase-like protein n=1 Tax=Candidatus Nitrosocosmicus arcticus TaxID=2035267 RepID=A0A557SX46_9ARCH|nr:nitroreductase [Candidatus Nitrosocosmicus arcticus]TVP41172.1 nitroreductase-like protein [Candidatus Nitrosocosmicus arcticus]